MNKPQYIGQLLYIKPTMVVSVPEFDTPRNYFSHARLSNHHNLKRNKHESKLSEKAQKRIKNAINWLIVSAKEKTVYQKATGKRFNFKVNLITLTLPDTAKEITEKAFKSELMHPFLVYMKKYSGLKNYVWKLEFQQNGKLHIHITTDTFIHYDVLRHYWNSLLKKHGYLDEFIKKFKHDNPNSTDVHSVWKVKNLGAYIAKYMAKNEETAQKIKGRIWGCNYELSDKNKCVLGLHRDECAIELRQLMNKEIKYKAVEYLDSLSNTVRTSAEIFFIELDTWKTYLRGKLRETYDHHRFKIRNNITHQLAEYTI